jgi:hypothetical protein
MKLVALRCPNCGQPLKPEDDSIVLSCHNCFIPVALAVDGPKRMKIWFAVMKQKQQEDKNWVPFWVYEGRIKIQHRETQSGWRTKDEDSDRLWGVPRRLFIPAWDLDLHTAQDIGSRLILKQPEFNFVEQPAEYYLTPANVKPDDAKRLLEFIVLAIEARRKDWLKDLKFEIEVGKPQLWALLSEGFY